MRYDVWYASTTSAMPLCTAATAATRWLPNGITGFANHRTFGIPSAAWMSGADGIDPHTPSTSAAETPLSRRTAVQASSARDAGLRSEFFATKPVVATFEIATRSLMGLRPELTAPRPLVPR